MKEEQEDGKMKVCLTEVKNMDILCLGFLYFGNSLRSIKTGFYYFGSFKDGF